MIGSSEPEAWKVPRKSWKVRRREWGIWWRRSRTGLTTIALVTALAALVATAAVRGAGTTPAEPRSVARPTVPALSAARPSEAAASRDERPSPVKFGVFSGTAQADTRTFEKWAGQDITYAIDFGPRQTWADIATPHGVLSEWGNSRYTLVLAVPMLPSTLNPDNDPQHKDRLMRRGGRGKFDQHFVTLAENLVANGQEKAVLRVGWEFNLRSWAWGTDNEKLYIAFYRQIVDAMRSVPGAQFEFDWNPNNGFNPNPGEKYYPGDDYVDYVGVDVYDLHAGVYPYPKGCDAACREERQIRAWNEAIFGGPRGLHFWTDFAARHGKPVALPEWGLWDRFDRTGGQDNPLFIEFMHDYISRPVNNVAYASYFNLNSEQGRHSLTESFPLSARTFRELFAQ